MTEAGLDLQGVEDALPLSPAQQGMLFHSLSEPETGVYLGLFSALLPADLDVDAFKASWRDAIARHQALRGLFVWAGVDEPLLVVRDEADPVWEELDWRGLGASDTQSAQREQLDAARRAGLDLSQAPAMRLILTLLRDGRRRFLWVCHHALVDDWSAANVLREVQQHYAQRVRGVATALPPAMPYRDFADWLAGQSREACDAYWGEAFAGVEEPTRLQTPPAEGTARHDDPYGVVEVVLSADATESLVRTAASLRTTLGNMTTAVWGVVLHRLSGLDDVMFGVAATMRPSELPGVDDAVGNFVTTLPARLRIDQSATMRDLIRVRHEDALAARAHKGISLTRLHELTGLPQGEPLFDTIISIKQDAMAQIASEGETALFSEITGRVRSNFPLALIVMPGERLKLELLFDESIIGEESARMILMMAERAMIALPGHLDRLPFDLPVMTDAERAEAEAGDAS
ncbi:MAG: condensation domain-containing protein, partial [Alphaproteobacteria bacterium]|nr:condensation domain-containing protein [Alphaproteobacteria bacterium]